MIHQLLCLLLMTTTSLQRDSNGPGHGTTSTTSPQLSTLVGVSNFQAEDDVSLRVRNQRSQATIFSYVFKDSEVQYNISIDVSGCGYSVKKNTVAGIYTYHNGTIKDEATVEDIVDDLKSIENEAPSAEERQKRLANHTMTGARSLEMSSNALLDKLLIVDSPQSSDSGEVVHNELRRLLWNWSSVKNFLFERSVLLLSSVTAAALGGGVTMVGGVYSLSRPQMDQSDLVDRERCTQASVDEDRIDVHCQQAKKAVDELRAKGEDPSEALERYQQFIKQRYDADKTRQELCAQADSATKAKIDRFVADKAHYRAGILQARNSAIITATTVFAATLSAGIVNDLAVRRRMNHQEAVPAHVLLAVRNRIERELRASLAREAQEMAVQISGANIVSSITEGSTTSSSLSTTWSSSLSSSLPSLMPSPAPAPALHTNSTPASAPPFSINTTSAERLFQMLPFMTSEDTSNTGLIDRTLPEILPAIRREHHIDGQCQV